MNWSLRRWIAISSHFLTTHSLLFLGKTLLATKPLPLTLTLSEAK